MKVTVLGAGAVGAMLGGLIRQHDAQVDLLLVARGAHAARMRETGHVVLEGSWGAYRPAVRVIEDLSDVAGSDYILLTVKSQDTETVMRQAADFLGQAVVISVQNGINQHVLANYVRPDRLLVGMTATNMAMLEPGAIRLQRNGITVVGPPHSAMPDDILQRATALLQTTALPVEAQRSILGVQYNKLLINTMGYASVLSDANFITDGILNRAWRRAVALPLLAEGLQALDAAGIELGRTPGISDVLRFRRLLYLLDKPLVDRAVHAIVTRRRKSRRIVYSVYQDLLRGRETEIEFINGEIVHLAEFHGGRAPYNRLVVAMVHELEQRAPSSFFSHAEVIDRFRRLGAAQ
ncbi:MAG: ketopantoate reductase family protein [Pirellulales bacterium]